MNKYLGTVAVFGLAFTVSLGLQNVPSSLLKSSRAEAATVERARAKDNAKLGSELELKINQVANLNSEKLKIRILRVVEDSRCPANARCITAGKVSIAVKIVQDNRDLGEFILTLDPADPKSATQTAGNYAVQLTDVQPYRLTSQELKPSDYRMKLVVTKAP